MFLVRRHPHSCVGPLMSSVGLQGATRFYLSGDVQPVSEIQRISRIPGLAVLVTQVRRTPDRRCCCCPRSPPLTLAASFLAAVRRRRLAAVSPAPPAIACILYCTWWWCCLFFLARGCREKRNSARCVFWDGVFFLRSWARLGCGMAGVWRPSPAALHRNRAPRFALAVVQSLVFVAIVVVADAC